MNINWKRWATHLMAAPLCAALITGCTTTQQQHTAATPWAAAPAPVPMAVSSTKTEGMINSGLTSLTKRVPAVATLGDEYSYDLIVTALSDCADVVVTDTVPAGATYVSSTPAAMQDGGKLTWKVPTMNKGETKTMKVRLKADREGELTGCATITSIPRVCVTTIVGKPAIAIEKSGPEYAKLGDNITYTIVVRNTGSAVANSVVITDTVPDGLAHSSGQKTLTFPVGDLAPGASKTQTVVLKAMERG